MAKAPPPTINPAITPSAMLGIFPRTRRSIPIIPAFRSFTSHHLPALGARRWLRPIAPPDSICPGRAGLRASLLADATVDLVRDGRGVLVDVVDAALSRTFGRELDGDGDAGLLDAFHLVVDRAVRAVDGELGTAERARPGFAQRQVIPRRRVSPVVDELPAGAA